MDKVLERCGSWVKVEFNTSSTCNSACPPHALAIWVEFIKRKWGYSYLSSSCFTIPTFLLSIVLPQAEPAYDHAWQTFQPWKHCLFLAVICAAARRVPKNTPFPRNVNEMDRLIIYSLYQPMLFRSEAVYSLLSATIACFWPCFFSTPIFLYLDNTSVSASGCAKSNRGGA